MNEKLAKAVHAVAAADAEVKGAREERTAAVARVDAASAAASLARERLAEVIETMIADAAADANAPKKKPARR